MRDQYIGIDLHKAFFQACAVTTSGERLWEGRFPRTPAGLEALRARCTLRSAVAVEASTPTWHFADGLVDAVRDLRIVDPLKTKLKAGYAAKTDRLDARRLADALRRQVWSGSTIRRSRSANCGSSVAVAMHWCRCARR
jgi:transposase